MSTWEDLVVNEPHLSSLPPALASSLVKELQGAKVELQNQYDMFLDALASLESMMSVIVSLTENNWVTDRKFSLLQ